MKKAVLHWLEKTVWGQKMVHNYRYRTVALAVGSLIVNLLYAFYLGALGLRDHSVWLIASCPYYLLLGLTRFLAITVRRRKGTETTAAVSTGILLTAVSIVMGGMLYVSLWQDTATRYGTIPMITIATYTFTKITTAVTKAVKHRKDASPLLRSLHTIRYAEVAVSVFTMQKSMLVSFGEMPVGTVRLFNGLTGTAVCLFITYLGVSLIMQRKKEKSL